MRITGQIAVVLFLFGTLTRLAGQVYSVNLVGYSSRTIPLVTNVTQAYISNPLYSIDDRLSSILRGVPDGTMLLLHRNGGFEVYVYDLGLWVPEDTTLHPGKGAILFLDRSAASNPTFLRVSGEVPQGMVVNPIPPGESLRASILPIEGRITTDLKLNPGDFDTLYLFNQTTQSEDAYIYDPDFGWVPFEPIIPIFTSFRYVNESGSVNNWTQIFSLPFRASDSTPVTASSTYPLTSTSLLCPVGPVRLSIRRIPSQVQVSWPLEFNSYQLQSSANPTGLWSQVSQPPATIGERLQVTLSTSSARSFY